MNNLECIATYIHENPGARYTTIIQNLMLYKGFSAERIAKVGGQYSTYMLAAGMRLDHKSMAWVREDRGYTNWLWEKIDKSNRCSGYKLTKRGLVYVQR